MAEQEAYCVIPVLWQQNTIFNNRAEIRLFCGQKGLCRLRCAVFSHEDGRNCPEVRSVYSMTTVFMATKTVVKETRTVVMAGKPRNGFKISGRWSQLFYYRRFSVSSGFPQYPVFLLPRLQRGIVFSFSAYAVSSIVTNSSKKPAKSQIKTIRGLTRNRIWVNLGLLSFFPVLFVCCPVRPGAGGSKDISSGGGRCRRSG